MFELTFGIEMDQNGSLRDCVKMSVLLYNGDIKAEKQSRKGGDQNYFAS